MTQSSQLISFRNTSTVFNQNSQKVIQCQLSSTSSTNEEICLSQQFLKEAFSGQNKLERVFAIIKSKITGTLVERKRVLEQAVMIYLSKRLKINVLTDYFQTRPSISLLSNPQKIAKNAILFYGTDFINATQVEDLLKKRHPIQIKSGHKLGLIGSSCCKLVFTKYQDAQLMAKQLKIESQTFIRSANGCKQEEEWIQLEPYYIFGIRRRLFACLNCPSQFLQYNLQVNKYNIFQEAIREMPIFLLSKFKAFEEYKKFVLQSNFQQYSSNLFSQYRDSSRVISNLEKLRENQLKINRFQKNSTSQTNKVVSEPIIIDLCCSQNVNSSFDDQQNSSYPVIQSLSQANKLKDYSELPQQSAISQKKMNIQDKNQQKEVPSKGVTFGQSNEIVSKQKEVVLDYVGNLFKICKKKKQIKHNSKSFESVSESDSEDLPQEAKILKRKRKLIAKKGYLPFKDESKQIQVYSILTSNVCHSKNEKCDIQTKRSLQPQFQVNHAPNKLLMEEEVQYLDFEFSKQSKKHCFSKQSSTVLNFKDRNVENDQILGHTQPQVKPQKNNQVIVIDLEAEMQEEILNEQGNSASKDADDDYMIERWNSYQKRLTCIDSKSSTVAFTRK